MQEQGVITNLLLAILVQLLNWLYALLPDLDLDAFLASYNQTTSLDGPNASGIAFNNEAPYMIILKWMATFNVFLPVRECFQLTAFGALGYLALWGYFFGWKFIKTVRGSG